MLELLKLKLGFRYCFKISYFMERFSGGYIVFRFLTSSGDSCLTWVKLSTSESRGQLCVPLLYARIVQCSSQCLILFISLHSHSPGVLIRNGRVRTAGRGQPYRLWPRFWERTLGPTAGQKRGIIFGRRWVEAFWGKGREREGFSWQATWFELDNDLLLVSR